MNIPKAIGILQIEQRCVAFKGATDRQSAIKLGIEALKRLREYRIYKLTSSAVLLPGETKD